MRCRFKCLYEGNRWQEKDSLHYFSCNKFAVQMIFTVKDSLRSKKSKNFAIQRKSADDPFNFEKLENFWHSAEIEGYGSGREVV